MQSVGPVKAKGMFGGYGLFLDNLMFGLVADNTLYLKADKLIENDYITKNLEAFTYIRQGKSLTMSYYQAPEEALENSDEMNIWANKAF